MSYILYINGFKIDLKNSGNDIGQTKQVNDLASLSSRQTNFSNRFTAPLTANNITVMKQLNLVGSNSNIPYQKNSCDLIDADTGIHLIYKGWANITQTTNQGYDIYVYDGIIDFYRKIENKSLTDCDVSGLNHAKSLTNIISSWANTLPYIYAIADYNGKNSFISNIGTNVEINTDYQVPSARISYIWNKIFEFSGFTYAGNYFETEDFKNLFMTFPKPVPINETSYLNIENHFAAIKTYNNLKIVDFFPSQIPANNYVTIGTNCYVFETAGIYKIRAAGLISVFFDSILGGNEYYPIISYVQKSSSDVPIASGSFNIDNSGFAILTINVGDKLFLFNEAKAPADGIGVLGPVTLIVSLTIFVDIISGYLIGFDEALLDFKATEFVNEIMQRAGLTAFKDKYLDHIDFLTMKEILQSNSNIDWSSKFISKASEKYKIGKYAKKNNFKYRYNSENETHNDGFIIVNDENLTDEINIIKSKIYSPENNLTLLNGRYSKVFKIWDKNLKENGIIEYKDLSGRFYFLRFNLISTNTTIGSKQLIQEQSIVELAIANFNKLSFKEILIDNYSTIETILNKSKFIEAYFWLNIIDIHNFDFKKLIYVEQLSSYYLVNKIVNFVKGKKTKLELIEVDYLQETVVTPPVLATYLTIDNFTVVGCEVTITYSTDAVIGTAINLLCYLNNFGLPGSTNNDPIYGYNSVVTNSSIQNIVTFNLLAGGLYLLRLDIQNLAQGTLVSNVIGFENSGTCLIYSPNSLSITNVTLIEITTDPIFGTPIKNYKIDFISDSVLPKDIFYSLYTNLITSGSDWQDYIKITANTNSIIIQASQFILIATKIRLRIGNLVSNDFNLP